MRRLLIAGTGSGCGKTTITCAILEALCRRGLTVSSFKCGPDYIDPMFHTAIIGTEAHNLDGFFCSPDTLCHLLTEYGGELAVMEGVMGFYDGAEGSAHAVSEVTNTPAILVIDCKGMGDSIGAVMQGFLHYKPNRIAGFIFNRLPASLVPLAKRLCDEMHTQFFGCFPASAPTLGSRHLGLVTAGEIADLKEKMRTFGELAEQYLLIDRLLGLPEHPLPEFQKPVVHPIFRDAPPVIAVARDRAFCFLYAENLRLLEQLGCELVYFSPISDAKIPEADGLLLCGGYPELYARQLSENESMRSDMRQKILSGMPVIAECGGFLYLHKTLENGEGKAFPMVGLFDANGISGTKLRRFGYVTMTAAEDNLLCEKGVQIRAHEFHHWDSTDCGEGFIAEKKDGRRWSCCHVSERMYAGFPHLYFYSDIRTAERFVRKCAEYGGKHEQDIMHTSL